MGPTATGVVWGHAASRNLSHWTRLPVAVWNGPAAYDSHAIFTGSVTIVDGKPVAVYAGRGPNGGYCAATPADSTDPLYKVWSKTEWAPNPMMHGDDDPSTAWRTAGGEWRLIGNTRDNTGCTRGGCAAVYASTDFKNWTMVGPVVENPNKPP